MKTVLSFLLLLTVFNTQAQKACDTIRIHKDLGKVYSYQKQKLKPKQMLELMEPNPMAYRAMKRAKTNYNVGCVFAYAGGFLVGWSLGSLISKGEIDWRIGGAGAGLIGLSIPFSIGQNRHTKKAVQLFNDAAKTSTCRIHFNINCTANKLGFAANF